MCVVCHALTHLGLLTVEGDPLFGLKWKAVGDSIVLEIREEGEDLSALSKIVQLSRYLDTAQELPKKEPKEQKPLETFQGVVLCLVKLGFSKVEAKERVELAVERLSEDGRKPTEEEVLSTAVRRSA